MQIEYLSKKNLSTRLLAHAPQVAAWLENKAVIDDFLQQNDDLIRNWKFPLEFLSWLQEQPIYQAQFSHSMIKELLMSACVRWSLQGLEHIHAKGILIATKYLNAAAVLWKSTEAGASHKIQFWPMTEPAKTNYYIITKAAHSFAGETPIFLAR